MIRSIGFIATLWLMVANAALADDTVVVVELYTSQGCSSCPPADAYFLDKLAQRDDVIALALHVDYWDYIGWKDNFANPAYTKRQKLYAAAAGHRSVYTPQMIVNGQDHVVGTHPEKVEKLIRTHKSRVPSVDLSISRKGNRLRIEATAQQAGKMQIHLVRYLSAEKVAIKRGENAGKVLTYANIVEQWDVVKDWNGRNPLSIETRAKGDAPLVVLVQHANGGPILAAARLQ